MYAISILFLQIHLLDKIQVVLRMQTLFIISVLVLEIVTQMRIRRAKSLSVERGESLICTLNLQIETRSSSKT